MQKKAAGRKARVSLFASVERERGWKPSESLGSSCYLNFALTMTIIMVLDYLDMVSERHRET